MSCQVSLCHETNDPTMEKSLINLLHVLHRHYDYTFHTQTHAVLPSFKSMRHMASPSKRRSNMA